MMLSIVRWMFSLLLEGSVLDVVCRLLLRRFSVLSSCRRFCIFCGRWVRSRVVVPLVKRVSI